jgi:large subunit ribosomal protein L21
MYAVIRAGGRQQRVKAGDVIQVDFMKVDPGTAVEFTPLLVVDEDGKAHVGKDLAKAKVVARLLGDTKAEKIKVFRYQPKSGYHRMQGHRQPQTVLEVEEVALSPDRVERKAEPAPAKKPDEKPSAKKPAAKKSAAKKSAAKKSAAAEAPDTEIKPDEPEGAPKKEDEEGGEAP